MSTKRQKNQEQLALPFERKGEAPTRNERGIEVPMAERRPESPARVGSTRKGQAERNDPLSDERLMEQVCQRENLLAALQRVRQNRGDPGIDGMTVDELGEYLKANWPTIQEQLLSGMFQSQPVRRVEIPKNGGGVRKLGIPTVLDRFIQQALLQVLQGEWDRSFSERSYGFRPKRSAHQAVAQAQQYVAEGYRYVVDIDLEKFFDRVNHDMLMGRVAKRVKDKRVLKLTRAFLCAGVMENGLVSPTEEGTPQGGPISPFLSNIVLDDLDKELERRGLRFVRYADDCNIYVRSERAGHRVMESIARFITRKLKLKVNQEKSAVGRPAERKFLGFRLIGRQEPKRGIAPQAIERFKARVRELTGRSQGRSLKQVIEKLGQYLRGWLAYFGFCQTPSTLRDLESWIRRRLRCLMWKQWKRGRTRYKRLRNRGIDHVMAAQAAGSPRGLWRLSHSPALDIAFPAAYFRSLGLPTLAPRQPA